MAAVSSAILLLFLLSFHAFLSMASDDLGFHSFVLMVCYYIYMYNMATISLGASYMSVLYY